MLFRSQLMTVLKVIKPIKATCTETTDNLMMASFGEQLNECNTLIEKIKREIVKDPPPEKSDAPAAE